MAIFSTIPSIVSATTNGHSQADAVKWITDREAEGWALDYDHTGGKPQCVDLIKYYLDYLGAGGLAGGNAYAYANKNVSAYGWTYTSTPSPGDIAVWEAYKGIAYEHGHVALVKSVNGSNFNYVDVNGATGLPGKGSLSISNPSTFIHPDFSSSKITFDAPVKPSDNIGAINFSVWFNNNNGYNLSAVGFEISVNNGAFTPYTTAQNVTWTRSNLECNLSNFVNTNASDYKVRAFVTVGGETFRSETATIYLNTPITFDTYSTPSNNFSEVNFSVWFI